MLFSRLGSRFEYFARITALSGWFALAQVAVLVITPRNASTTSRWALAHVGVVNHAPSIQRGATASKQVAKVRANGCAAAMKGSASQAASTRLCSRAAGNSGNGISINFTPLDVPPFL